MQIDRIIKLMQEHANFSNLCRSFLNSCRADQESNFQTQCFERELLCLLLQKPPVESIYHLRQSAKVQELKGKAETARLCALKIDPPPYVDQAVDLQSVTFISARNKDLILNAGQLLSKEDIPF